MKVLSIFRAAKKKLSVHRVIHGSFAFIHINKCGGTSVETALGLPKLHDTARQRRDAIGVARWNRIPSFALVRCPYAKVMSHYRYRVKTDQTGMASGRLGLNEWVRRAYGEQDPLYFDKPQMFAPCSDWITDESGKMMVDLVVRLEEINEEWHRVMALIGRSAVLPRVNTTSGSDVPEQKHLDSSSVSIINELFRDDFEVFGYSQRTLY